jgi:WD40 repeat protein
VRTFSTGAGRVHQLRYSPDGKYLVVDLREKRTGQPGASFNFRSARELVWWNWVTGEPVRRFRLRDSLYGPGGACSPRSGDERGDWQSDAPARDVSFCFDPWRIATAWEWTNKEDGNCVFDADGQKCVYLSTPYKTHTGRLALAPDGTALVAVTFNDMDGSGLIEHWPLEERSRRAKPSPGRDAMRTARISTEREDTVELSVNPEALVFDGRFVAAGGAGEPDVQCWDTQDPVDPVKAVLEPGDPDFNYAPLRNAELLAPEFAPCALALGGSDHLLAIGGDGLVVWNAGRRKPVCSAPVDAALMALAFDARAERLVAGTVSGNLELWDVASGCRLRSLACGIGSITSVCFALDGLTCAAGGEGGQVAVWDVDG